MKRSENSPAAMRRRYAAASRWPPSRWWSASSAVRRPVVGGFAAVVGRSFSSTPSTRGSPDRASWPSAVRCSPRGCSREFPFAIGAYALFGGVAAIVASLPAAALATIVARHDDRGAAASEVDGDDRLLPRGRLRPDQQLRRHRRRAARARAPRRLHRRGVVRGHARGAGLRGAPDAPRPAAGAGGGARAVLDGLHPRHGAGLPQADDRAARRVHRAHVRGALRRRALRPRAPARDHRRARARRDRRGQRRLLPGARRERAPLGAHRLLQPARDARSGARAGVLGLPRGRPLGLGGVPRRVPAHARRAARLVRRVPARGGRAAAARARVHGHLALPQPLRLSRRGRLPPLATARRDLAQRADERAHERAVGAARAAARRRRARCSTSRSARSARPTSS